MHVFKLQTETTFNLEGEEVGYTVTVMEDFTSGNIHWDIVDDDGNEVEDEDLLQEIVAIIEANRD
jgi:hypothetical protein